MVPVDFLRGVHGCGQDDEDPEAADKEGVALQLHDDVDEGVEDEEQQPDEEGGAVVLEQSAHEEGDEADGHDRGDDVGEEEGEVLGEGEQQDVEEHEGDAHEGILYGMDGGKAAVLDKEDYGKSEQDDEIGVLDAAGGLLVLLHRHLEVNPKRLGIAQLAVRAEHLGKVAVEGQHLPVGGKSLFRHLAVGGQVAAGEAGSGAVGGEVQRSGASHGQEVEVVGTFKGHSEAVGDFVAVEDRLDIYSAREGVVAAEVQGFGGEVSGLAVIEERGIVGKAFEVGDGKEQLGAFGTQVFQLFGFDFLREGEVAAEVERGLIDGKVIDAAFQHAGLYVALDVEVFGQQIDVVGCRVARDEEHGTREGLSAAPFLGDFEVGCCLGAAALVHHVHDDGLRNKQQNADD